MMNVYSALVVCIVAFGATFMMGFSGVGSDKIPDDVSVRLESADGTGRMHGGGGLRHGK